MGADRLHRVPDRRRGTPAPGGVPLMAVFLSAEELAAAPLGSFIPAFGGGRWMRVDGGWVYRITWYGIDGERHHIRGEAEPTLDAIRPHELRRAATVFIQYRRGSSAWMGSRAWVAFCSQCKWHAYKGTLPEIHDRANEHARASCCLSALQRSFR